MGLFDRKSTTTNLQEITNRNTAVESSGGVTVAGSENVNVLDGGAIGGIENTAIQAIRSNQGLVDESLDFGKVALLGVGSAFEQAGAQTQRVLETTTGQGPSIISENTVKFGIAAAVVAVGLFVLMKRK